jgi:acyl-coenzyme A synthetase/AMP-(fatty) acid ligase/acyl carrier protein
MVPHRVREWRRRFGGSHRLCNTYGPTEAGVVATVHDVGPHDGAAKMIPIGRPLPGVEAYVLDEGLRPVPVGAPGELHLGGQQLARGYRFDPTTTATRFVPHPYGAPGARLLRTGDRCAWRPDGALEFLGRIDDQVKVRGHRVEPTEVEAALATYPGVWAAAVVAVEASDDSVRLVAHVAADPRPSADDLRRHLAARLPDALVPSTFVVRDELPMTTSGKIDRVALRALPAAVTEPRAYIAATTPEEQLVAAIWAEVFELAAVGLDDDFIELGGHSLLATQVVARIEEETGIALPIRAVFDAPTIDELAELLVRTAIESVDPDELARLLDDLE